MYNQMIFLSGLPRTGSTLLNSILYQNPNIYAEGHSSVSISMMHIHKNISDDSLLRVNHRESFVRDLLESVPKIYYKDVNRSVIIDKSVLWCLPDMNSLITNYIDPDPKIIVLVRPVEEIFRSFNALAPNDPRSHQDNFFREFSVPLMLPLVGVRYARECNSGNFLFVNYHDIVDNTIETLQRIYDFCGWDWFPHTTTNIVSGPTEDDDILGVPGFHDVRPEISKREVDFELTSEQLEICLRINEEYRVLG